MKSYVSICEIEGKYTELEIERVSIEERNNYEDSELPCDVIVYLTDVIINEVGEIEEGDILVVEQEENTITKIYCKDEKEKQRRINYLLEIMNI